MSELLGKYNFVDERAHYVAADGKKYAQSVHGNSYIRANMAIEQAKKDPVPVEEIVRLVTGFLKDIGIKTADDPVVHDPLKIDYKKIKETYGLADERDIVWMKFTEDGYLGVVAVSSDINFFYPFSASDYDLKYAAFDKYQNRYVNRWVFNTSGIIIHKLNKKWDESFVLVFPLNGIPEGYERGDIECAVGNFLIEKGVPVLDYFSHMY